MLKKIGILAFLMLITIFSFSQKDTLRSSIDTIFTSKYNKWSIYGYGGLTQLYGDVVPHYSYSPLFMRDDIVSLNGFVGVSRQLTRLFSIDGRFEVANLVSERPYSNIYSKSDMFYYSLGTTFSFSNWFWPNVKNRKWNSYLILTTGFTHYRSASFDTRTDQIIDYYGYRKENNTLVKEKREVVPSAAIGIGVKYRISKRLDIGFEFIETSVYNDRLDAYVRVLSEKDKFGHTSLGLIYRFEKHKKSLVWDFVDEPVLVDLIIKNQLCDCPIISKTVTVLDSLTQIVNTNTNRTDSILYFIERERGPDIDNDKIPDYRDEELTTPVGAIVDNKGVTLKDINQIPYSFNIKPLDSLTQANIPQNEALMNYYNQLTIKVDSFFKYIEKEKGADIDKDGIPDYRDEELNTSDGAVVNHRGITIFIPSQLPIIQNLGKIDTTSNQATTDNIPLQSFYNQLTFKVDSLLRILEKERGQDVDKDKVPDYRDDELSTAVGALVDYRGVTIVIPNQTYVFPNNSKIDTSNKQTNSDNIPLQSFYNQLSFKVDSLLRILEKERGQDLDNDKVPDYRDEELSTPIGAIVDSRGVRIKTQSTVVPINTTVNTNGKDTFYVQNYTLPNKHIDSLAGIVSNLNLRIDTLMNKQYTTGNNQIPNSNQNNSTSNQNFVIPQNGTINTDYTTNPQMMVYKGVVQDEYNKPIKASIFVIDKSNNEMVGSFETNSITGKYVFSLPVGKEYSFLVSADGYGFYSENISLKDSLNNVPVDKGISLIKLEVGKKFVLRNIFFDFDKATLRPQSNIELNNLYNIMIANPNLKIEISGHTDIIGTAAYNKVLSLNRAKAVVDYLISRGISKSRMVYAGYGFDDPIAPNDTDEGRQLNRRTEFKIIGN